MLPLVIAGLGLGAWLYEHHASGSARMATPAWRLLSAKDAWVKSGQKGNPPPVPYPIPEMQVVLVIQNTTTNALASVLCKTVGENGGRVSLLVGPAFTPNGGVLATAPYGYEQGKFIDVDPSNILFTH